LVGLSFFVFPKINLKASSTSPLNITVGTSVCGNLLKEQGEDCDNTDLNGKTCENLGFDGGTLTCDIACSFETASCTVPAIDPTNVAPSDVGSLVAAGLFDIPSSASIISTPVLTATVDIVVSIPAGASVSAVLIPSGVSVQRVDGEDIDPTALTTSVISESQFSGLTGKIAKAVLQWGLTDATLEFSDPIVVNAYVGSDLNGETLNVVRSTSLTGGWTNEGIVSPATCLVSAGICTFQTTEASYFAAIKEIATSTPTPTPTASSTSSSGSSSNTSTTTTATTTSYIPAFLVNLFRRTDLPILLQNFDPDGDGRITSADLAIVASSWVNGWTDYINSGFTESENCDINGDDLCDLKDFSILLFYTGR
jgi:hypothetical protein